MGTRNLTVVVQGGKNVVAQYGQWDGYPSGQGNTALKFCRKLNRGKNKEKFLAGLKKIQWATDEDHKAALAKTGSKDGWLNTQQSEIYHRELPYVSRDFGADILDAILKSKDDVIKLRDSSSFASDSLFCEWTYVIDLDKVTLEVYRGFNTDPLPAGERFAALPKGERPDGTESEYYPVRHVVSFSLNKLPTTKDFLKKAEPPEEEG